MDLSQSTVRHVPDRSRYDLVVDGEVVGYAEYRDEGDRLVMHHTYTEPAYRGHGIAARVVAGALDDVRERGLLIVPTCWFVADFVDGHAEYRDLVAPRG